LITLNRETGNFEVDYDRFESTEPHPFLMVDSPSNDCSSATATPTGLTPLSSHCSSRPQSPCPPPPLATAIEICNEEFDQQQEEMRGGVPDDDFENILLANRPETRILMQQAADDLQKASDAKILV
jgi:hypothetical protein